MEIMHVYLYLLFYIKFLILIYELSFALIF